jgi:hypothetical protein
MYNSEIIYLTTGLLLREGKVENIKPETSDPNNLIQEPEPGGIDCKMQLIESRSFSV